MTVPENPPNRRFIWPADYYSSPSPRAVLPKWAPWGCGVASLLVLLVVFAGGAFLSSGGATSFIDFLVGTSLGELRGQMTADVTPSQKATFEAEVKTMRANLRNEKVSVAQMQPFLQSMSNAMRDGNVNGEDVEAMERVARNINRHMKR